MRKIICIILLQIFSTFAWTQTNIKGKISDQETSEAIPMAEIIIFKSADSSYNDAAYTDDSGMFEMETPKDTQKFYLQIHALGFHSKTIALESTENPLHIKLSKDLGFTLGEAKITALKKGVTLKGDKVIFDADLLGLSSETNGLEALQQLPGVSLDQSENIKFRGSTGIQFMINGRKSMLKGKALNEFIRSLSGDDIQSVEIITQPSARYEATGTTSIMNIVLRRNKLQTFGGNITTKEAYGEYFKHRSGARLFYNDHKWNLYASGSYYNGKSFNDRLVNQKIRLEDKDRKLEQSNYWLPKTITTNFSLGAEIKLGEHHLISTEWQGSISKENEKTTGKTLDYLNDDLQETVLLKQFAKSPSDQVSGNLFYNYTSDSSTTKIDAQINYGHYKKSIDRFQENHYEQVSLDRLDGANKTKYNLMNAQIDWQQKIGKQLEFEAGGKFSHVQMDYFNTYKQSAGEQPLIPDSLQVNNFKYQENLSSAYAQMNYNLKNWNFLTGLRIENQDYDATSLINHKSNSGNYTQWFPSASINYQQEKHQYRLSYSKRISRPDYLKLNPFYQYLDAYSIEQGNPNLKPQIYHSFELNYIYKNALSLELYGYLYKNGFIDVINYQPQENYNILYDSNASHGSRFGFSASIPYQIGDWWTMQYSLDTYLSSEKSEIPNYAYDGKGYGYEFNMYHRFDLPHNWRIQWNGFFSGRSETPTGYNPKTYDLSASVRKSFLEDQLQVTVGGINLLKKSMWNSYSTVEDITTHWINKWETRTFSLQIKFKFGHSKEKEIKKTLLNEQNRI